MDPISLIMIAMIGLLIIFMIRNSRKRKEMMAKLQDGIKPGAEVMLQSGIFGVIEEVEEVDSNRVLIRSGSSTLEVHRSAIGNIIEPVAVIEEEEITLLPPDDDPNFGVSKNNENETQNDDDPTENPNNKDQ